MQLLMNGVFNQFCITYAEQHRKMLSAFGSVAAFAEKFTVSESLVEEFMTFAEKEKVSRNKTQEKKSGIFIRTQLKALLARSVYRTEGYYRILNAQDPTVKKALNATEKL
jgi:carboxyl-terminal processing protease